MNSFGCRVAERVTMTPGIVADGENPQPGSTNGGKLVAEGWFIRLESTVSQQWNKFESV